MATAKRYNDWMTTLPARLTMIPITQLAIPGSHDSATSDFYPSLGAAVDLPAALRILGKTCCGKYIVHNWNKTQNLSVAEQLRVGIRYFDFRVAARPNTQEVRFVHGVYGGIVRNTLEIINRFLNDNTMEIVILDFNHFYNINRNVHKLLLNDIMEVFVSRLVPRRQDTITLQQLWETSNRVIVIYHDDDSIRDFPEIWPGNYITSPWANKDQSDKLFEFLENNYTHNQRPPNQFYSWQGVLTPRIGDVMLHPCSSLEREMADKATGRFVSWLTNRIPGPQGINVCIADFVEKYDYIPTVIGLNELMPL